MSFSTLMDRAWILKMLALPSRSGRENSTLRSRRPGLMRAGSRVSGLLVAINTLIFPRGSKPSNWLINSVQGVRSVGGHQHLDISSGIKTVQLVDQLRPGCP